MVKGSLKSLSGACGELEVSRRMGSDRSPSAGTPVPGD